jgi:hypothetical protein
MSAATHPIFLAVGPTAAAARDAVSAVGTTASGVSTFTAAPIVALDDATTGGVSTALELRHTTTGTASAGIGAGIVLRTENGSGTLVTAGRLAGQLSSVTATSENGQVEMLSAYAGTVAAAGIRLTSQVATVVNGFDFVPSAANGHIALAPYGASTNVEVRMAAKGTGDWGVFNAGLTSQYFGVGSTGGLKVLTTDGSGTPGAATINRASGKVAIATGQATVTVTNSLVSAASTVLAQIQTADATLLYIKSVVPGAGSFVITGNANATAATTVAWVVIN